MAGVGKLVRVVRVVRIGRVGSARPARPRLPIKQDRRQLSGWPLAGLQCTQLWFEKFKSSCSKSANISFRPEIYCSASWGENPRSLWVIIMQEQWILSFVVLSLDCSFWMLQCMFLLQASNYRRGRSYNSSFACQSYTWNTTTSGELMHLLELECTPCLTRHHLSEVCVCDNFRSPGLWNYRWGDEE